MKEMSVNRFRKHLREAVEEVLDDHDPLRVTRRGGRDFVVLGAEDWDRERETLYVLENRSLMEQISRSVKTHQEGTGRQVSIHELDEVDAGDRLRG